MPNYNTLQEEELKLRIAEAFFAQYDCNTRLGKIDFCVTQIQDTKHPTEGRETVSLLWAEAKRGIVTDIYKPFVQLILTIGKARTFETYLPPPFLAAFDAEKIAFIPYKDILPFFALNDFNWNITPSDDTSREFGLLYAAVKDTLERTSYIFRYDAHEAELREFIKQHLSESSEQIQINKNNFVSIYQRWLAQVQPSIDVNWEVLKKNGLIDGDFFLADLLSEKNQTIKEALFVLLQDNRYIVDRKIDARGLFIAAEVFFKDRQKAHTQFWSLYQRPPREEYWDYIIKRRDLLVPQDVRERKGSFFTPKIWVDLSQKYLADVLGENWQEEYYIWDCAAGTGNLLNGLTNKYNIWASTLDQQDVDVMKDRIKNGANLLESHVFQFDFLNDEFDCGKLPADLLDVLQNPEKRKKLVIYINPPYAEAPTSRTPVGTGKNRTGITKGNRYNEKFRSELGKAINEFFVLFLVRIYTEIPCCRVAHFSKLKILQSSNFLRFRDFFSAKLDSLFLVPANTFDNVNGKFPIGFYIWNSAVKENFNAIKADVYDYSGAPLPSKIIAANTERQYVISWLQKYYDKEGKRIAYLRMIGTDMQNNRGVYITNNLSPNDLRKHLFTHITAKNLLHCCIYVAIRNCILQTWLNDRDQFLYPNDGWENDVEFQTNCLVYMLFHSQNRITTAADSNHWIPFTEQEVNAHALFTSHFMTDFMAGRCASGTGTKYEVLSTTQSDAKEKSKKGVGSLRNLTEEESFVPTEPLVFSAEAIAVFNAGRELWRYYHAQPNANPNASYYDIREHFQGRNEKGKMNPKSDDAEYTRLLSNLKNATEVLRQKIVPKIYEYGFLV